MSSPSITRLLPGPHYLGRCCNKKHVEETMVLKRALGCLFVLTLASGILCAQGPKTSHTKDSGIRIAEPPATLKLIFSNLGPTVTDAYYDSDGYNVDGPSNA